jgi:hypothetical protein
MSGAMPEQRNRYKGMPPRSWILVHLIAPDGTSQAIEVLADTGSPYTLILGDDLLNRLQHGPAPSQPLPTSSLLGGVLRLAIPDVGFDALLVAYASDAIVSDARVSSTDFDGLAGLPLLRLFEYGGDVGSFWIRPQGSTP